MKMTHKFFALPVLMGALLIAGTTQSAHAAPTATTAVTLNITSIVDITATGATTLTPVRADYEAGFVNTEDDTNTPVSLNVFSNTPYTVSVQGQTSGATLASADISAKNRDSGSFTAINTPVQIVNSGVASDAEGDDYTVDLQVALNDMTTYAVGAGPYTNTITFTVAAAS